MVEPRLTESRGAGVTSPRRRGAAVRADILVASLSTGVGGNAAVDLSHRATQVGDPVEFELVPLGYGVGNWGDPRLVARSVAVVTVGAKEKARISLRCSEILVGHQASHAGPMEAASCRPIPDWLQTQTPTQTQRSRSLPRP